MKRTYELYSRNSAKGRHSSKEVLEFDGKDYEASYEWEDTNFEKARCVLGEEDGTHLMFRRAKPKCEGYIGLAYLVVPHEDISFLVKDEGGFMLLLQEVSAIINADALAVIAEWTRRNQLPSVE